ncbi:MAG: MFS transporter [Balneolaceae bacterium]
MLLKNPNFETEVRNRNHKKELYAVCAALSVLGLAFSSWAARVPDIRDAAFLTAATLGYALLMRGSGTVLMLPLVAMGINRFGAKKVALVTGLIVAFSLFPITLMNNWISLGFLLIIVGAASSSFNISVNALGSKVEKDTGRSHMSKIHSWFGIGNLSGALIGTLMVKFGVSAFFHFLGMSVLIVCILGFIYQYLPEDAPHPNAVRPRFEWPHGGLIALGAICFLGASVEGSINNWIGLFFTDYIKVEEGYGPIGYTLFAGALLGMRIIGDRLKNRFGAKKLVVVGTTSASIGIILAVLVPNIFVSGFGILIAGAGVALTFPMVFSAAGREGAIALTSVAAFSSIGGMVSQPILGLIVEGAGLFGGFLFIATCSALIALIASRARLLRS